MVTGGAPRTTGVFYDDAYARNMWKPGSDCTGPSGTETLYAENLDKLVNGVILLMNGVIDPANLPMGMVGGKCVPVYPHSFMQTNTIFNVTREAGMYTAWSDKHPAYEIINGPSGVGVNDLYTPEINNVNDPTTISVAATDGYDQIKVKAILNEIDGKRSDGSKSAPVPEIFGMNFQSVSVGEKLVDPALSCKRKDPPPSTCDPNYVPGGYEPGTLKFTPQMAQAMDYVDGAIGSMVHELEKKELLDSTEIIISAKHGQSPIDPAQVNKIGPAVDDVLKAAKIEIAQDTTDDVALVWLADQKQTAAAVKALLDDKAGPNHAKVDYVLSGDTLADRFGDPLKNPRTPDLIVQPKVGVIYTGSKAKVAEHGGFSENDTHVALLVVSPGGNRNADGQDAENGGRTVATPVHTTQIAPTILEFLGLKADALRSVRIEGTRALPR